jgi:hypothetical protein
MPTGQETRELLHRSTDYGKRLGILEVDSWQKLSIKSAKNVDLSVRHACGRECESFQTTR